MKPVWTKRFFVVSDGMLLEKKELNTVNCLPLLTCTVKVRPDIDVRCFEVVSPTVSLILQAESEELMLEWKETILNVIAKELNNTQLPTSATNDATEKNYQENLMEHFQKISKENAICADCGAPNPEWASINLGILTCIECSGFHRSMGVHISKVRSLNLDKWDPELVQLMDSIGNANANKIFETNVCSPWSKPNSKSPKEQREKWIRAKYAQKIFVNQQLLKDPEMQFHNAAKKNDHFQCLQLLAQGTDIDNQSKSDNGRTPLQNAIQTKSLVCVQLLVLNRANIGICDYRRWNAFHYAAEIGDVTCLLFLLKNCDNKNVIELEDLSGSTPMDVAMTKHNNEVVTLLLDYEKTKGEE